jgi:hypothetical protein
VASVVVWKRRGGGRDGQARTCGRRGDSAGAAGGGSRVDSGRGLPQARHQSAEFLSLEEELRELRQLREENNQLKRLVADLSLDRHILQEIVAKKL